MSGKVSGTEPRGNSGGSPSCAAHIYGRCDGSPEGDRSLPLKYVTKFEYGDALAQDVRGEGTTPVFGSNGVVGSHDVANTLAPSIIIGRKGSFGKVTWADMPAFCIDTAYYIDKRHTKANLRWLYWMLQTLGLDMFSEDTGVPGLSREKAYRVHVPYPPLPEQTRIANFLDEQTARIDALIAEKERLDALLGEYRGSLISAAVTGYLDVSAGTAVPKTEKRNEPVTNCQLKHLASMKSGESISSDEILQDGPYPVYGGNGLRGYTGNYTHAQTGPLIGRQGALCGNVTFVSGAFWATEHAIVATPREGVWPRWLFWLLEGLDLNQYSVAAAQPGLAVEALTRVRTVKPQFSTQVRIANFLDEQTARIDDLRNHCREHIALLREYRSSLISAAVTGQLDIDSFEKGVA